MDGAERAADRYRAPTAILLGLRQPATEIYRHILLVSLPAPINLGLES